MNKLTILEVEHNTICDNLDWAIDSEDKDKVFANYIDGVVTMTNNLLSKLDE